MQAKPPHPRRVFMQQRPTAASAISRRPTCITAAHDRMRRVVRGAGRRSWGILAGRFRRRIDPYGGRQGFWAWWSADELDQDGDLIDILVQPRRDGRAARRFFRRLLKSQRQEPVRLVTDKLGSYRVAHRDLMPLVTHDTRRYANNRAEVSHQPTRQRERQMRGFTSSDHAQRFLHVHGVIQNLFRVGRHLLRAAHHRMLRARSFTVWAQVTAA